ncbi:glycoside hydrolase family 88/105 protein [Mucilaginibacter aquatilis]|uniref:Glycoside hydrolase family 88 protein n=1 Tax=Mucilaginibacter aquatilis TaxID=1517760 RepID=A0A6I4I794_9SPHI|nr:glycoside hydrolase family 88 protein [Mucilaginibacter aquatilis]MVN90971.1 glycoside hydrolase family 88 protein [Mucilaginibacter aquatilis]
MKAFKATLLLCSGLAACNFAFAQKVNDVVTPLHAMKVNYPTPYDITTPEQVKQTLDRIFNYLDKNTPPQFVKRGNNQPVALNAIDTNTTFKPGDFRLTSYEWGVTYAGMLLAGQATGDSRYTTYTQTRLNFLADAIAAFKKTGKTVARRNPLHSVIEPGALDDCGALCAATVKTIGTAGASANLRPMADNFINFVSNKQQRFNDGTLSRNRPLKNTLWLDDMFMSVPAIAQFGKLTGDSKYYDDAVKQVLQFSKRMFNNEKNVYMHGWVQETDVHPQFHWGRANGWAFMAMTELLDVLPQSHPGYGAVLQQYQSLAKGLVSYQSGTGFWHQLLDRNDSYLETSATAIYAYCLARGINNGWLNGRAYGPAALLAWNATATKVNTQGQVEGVCVGTGMAFDPAFYYYRPVNVYAAHGYGPALLAGAEIINLLKKHTFEVNDSAVMMKN